jgi:hypothetical protein
MNSLVVIYSRGADQRSELRAIVIKTFDEHGEELFNKHHLYLSSLVKTRPLFAQDIAPMLFALLERRRGRDQDRASDIITPVEEQTAESAPRMRIRLVEKPGITDEERTQRLLGRAHVGKHESDDDEGSDEDDEPVVRRGKRKRHARHMGNYVSWSQFSQDYFDRKLWNWHL